MTAAEPAASDEMNEHVAQELEARLATAAEEARHALAEWRAARRRRWVELKMKLGALSGELAVARSRFIEALGEAPVSTRADLSRAFHCVRELDLERQRIEEEVWVLVRAAEEDERRFRARMLKQARRESQIPALVAEAMNVALEGARESSPSLAQTELGRRFDALHKHRLTSVRGDAERALARLDAELTRVLAGGALDWAEVGDRFAREVSERLSGDGRVAPRRPRPRRPPAPRPKARPAKKRKRARVPKFLLRGFYKKGNMHQLGDDVQLTFVNPLAFCIVQNGDAVSVDGRAHPTDQTTLDNGDKRILGTQLSPENYLKYPKGAALKLTLHNLELAPGPHRVSLSLELRKMGWIDLNISDEVS